jgi:hypothetical protein
MRSVLLLVFAFLVNSCFVRHVPNYSSREVISQAVMVSFQYIEDGNNNTNMASAFALNDSYILTAGHFCVNAFMQSKEKNIVFKVIDENGLSIIWGKNEIIWVSSPKLDYCLIETKSRRVTPFPIHTQQLHVGDKLAAIGAPSGVFPTRTYGEMIDLQENQYRLKDPYIANLSCAPGSSGSPVINEKGRLVGMIVSMLERNHSINFVTPITYICQDIKENLGIDCN